MIEEPERGPRHIARVVSDEREAPLGVRIAPASNSTRLTLIKLIKQGAVVSGHSMILEELANISSNAFGISSGSLQLNLQ